MTAINIQNLIEIVQRKVNGVSGSTSVRDLENLLELTMLSGGGHLMADSAGFDSDVADYPGRLIFVDSGDAGFFNFNQTIDRAVSSTVARRGPNRQRNFKYLKRQGTYTARSSGSSYSFQGSNYGYTAGGTTPSDNGKNVIDKFSFSTDGNATDVGDLVTGTYEAAGNSSTTKGYHTGGINPAVNTIQHYPFVTDANATDAADLTSTRYSAMGQSSQTHGYSSGGRAPSMTDIIEKYPFAADDNATDVADLANDQGLGAGITSPTHGYVAGGNTAPPFVAITNIIQKFTFATDANATDVGDLSSPQVQYPAGASSTTHGYASGGYTPPGNVVTIDKFSFSTDGNATDVGDLTAARYGAAGQSSTTHGYSSAGQASPGTSWDVIDKFSFSTDGNATDVGDSTEERTRPSGAQY